MYTKNKSFKSAMPEKGLKIGPFKIKFQNKRKKIFGN